MNAPNEPYASLAEDATRRFGAEIGHGIDEIFKNAFIKNGLPTDEEFIKNNCSLIIQEGDEFQHCWYHYGKPDAIRIISIEREPDISMIEEIGSYKMKAEYNYY